MARHRPTPAEAAEVRELALRALAGGGDLGDLLAGLAPLHPRDNTFPAEVLIGLSVDMLDVAGLDAEHRIDLDGARDRVLGDFRLRGREQQRLHTVVLIAPARRGGVETDLLDLTYWWNSDDLYVYACFALAIHAQLAADAAGLPTADLCQQVGARHGITV